MRNRYEPIWARPRRTWLDYAKWLAVVPLVAVLAFLLGWGREPNDCRPPLPPAGGQR